MESDNQRMFVYRNLHYRNQVMWSVRNVKTGRVEMHSPLVVLANATFKVSKAGRARVLRDKQKNVHAGVQGSPIPIGLDELSDSSWIKVTYNPYLYETFIRTDTGERIDTASKVLINQQGVFAKF